MSEEEEIVCENCGKKLSESVIKYLQENPNAFDGKKLCYKCQKEFTKQQCKLIAGQPNCRTQVWHPMQIS